MKANLEGFHPFSPGVMNTQLSRRWKLPNLEKYVGTSDLECEGLYNPGKPVFGEYGHALQVVPHHFGRNNPKMVILSTSKLSRFFQHIVRSILG